MQSRAHTRGSTLQNGIRQDAGGSEIASATTVFSLGKIDMTRRSLCYNTTLTSPRAAIGPDRSLAQEHIDNKCRRTPSPAPRARGLRTPQQRNGSKKPAYSEQPFELGKMTLTAAKRAAAGPGKHLIEFVARPQLAVQYFSYLLGINDLFRISFVE